MNRKMERVRLERVNPETTSPIGADFLRYTALLPCSSSGSHCCRFHRPQKSDDPPCSRKATSLFGVRFIAAQRIRARRLPAAFRGIRRVLSALRFQPHGRFFQCPLRNAPGKQTPLQKPTAPDKRLLPAWRERTDDRLRPGWL